MLWKSSVLLDYNMGTMTSKTLYQKSSNIRASCGVEIGNYCEFLEHEIELSWLHLMDDIST